MDSGKQFVGSRCTALRVLAFSCGMLALGVGAPAQGAQAASKAEAALAKCASDGKYAFVFFYREGASAPGKMPVTANTSQTQQLRTVFDAAMDKLSARALPVLVNVADASETAVVQRFRVSRTPMPWVMAVAPNGAITRGLARFTERDLLSFFCVSWPGESPEGVPDQEAGAVVRPERQDKLQRDGDEGRKQTFWPTRRLARPPTS